MPLSAGKSRPAFENPRVGTALPKGLPQANRHLGFEGGQPQRQMGRPSPRLSQGAENSAGGAAVCRADSLCACGQSAAPRRLCPQPGRARPLHRAALLWIREPPHILMPPHLDCLLRPPLRALPPWTLRPHTQEGPQSLPPDPRVCKAETQKVPLEKPPGMPHVSAPVSGGLSVHQGSGCDAEWVQTPSPADGDAIPGDPCTGPGDSETPACQPLLQIWIRPWASSVQPVQVSNYKCPVSRHPAENPVNPNTNNNT